MSVSRSNELPSKAQKFISFVAAMMAKHPEKCYANIGYLSSQPHDLQPYVAFLEVLTEQDSTVKELLKRGLGGWRELKEIYSNHHESEVISLLQEKLDGDAQNTQLDFGGTRGAHRKRPMRRDFGRALFEYTKKTDHYGDPVDLVSKDWRTMRDRLVGIRSFGPLAIFDYLERLALTGFTSPPDEYLETGGGPERGIEAIFGDSANMIGKGNMLLKPLLQITGNHRAIFALETFLCCMQKGEIEDSFTAFFADKISLDELISRYMIAFTRGTASPICPR